LQGAAVYVKVRYTNWTTGPVADGHVGQCHSSKVHESTESGQ